MTKTNALRILAAAGVPFTAREYDVSDGEIDGLSVAAKIGRAPDTVFKTLVAVGKTGGHHVFVIPVDCQLNLKKAAVAAREKNIEMIKMKDLEPLTGYVHGGCSPVGMKKPFPVYIEEAALLLDAMTVSAGRVGAQAELAPQDLARVTGLQTKKSKRF